MKYGLWKVIQPIENFAQELAKDTVQMKRHIRQVVAAWDHVKRNICELRPVDLLSLEDYQRNLEVGHQEMHINGLLREQHIHRYVSHQFHIPE